MNDESSETGVPGSRSNSAGGGIVVEVVEVVEVVDVVGLVVVGAGGGFVVVTGAAVVVDGADVVVGVVVGAAVPSSPVHAVTTKSQTTDATRRCFTPNSPCFRPRSFERQRSVTPGRDGGSGEAA